MTPDTITARVVAIAVLTMLAALLLILCFFTVPQPNHDIILTLTGMITGSGVTIVAFFYGSSASSRDKDDTIKTIATGR